MASGSKQTDSCKQHSQTEPSVSGNPIEHTCIAHGHRMACNEQDIIDLTCELVVIAILNGQLHLLVCAIVLKPIVLDQSNFVHQ